MKVKVTSSKIWGRTVYLVESTSGKSALFYKSTGTACPEIKKSGEVFPILGFTGLGILGTFLNRYRSKKSPWIFKAVTNDGRNDLESYFSSSRLRNISLKLENGELTVTGIVSEEVFIKMIDKLFLTGDNLFFTNACFPER